MNKIIPTVFATNRRDFNKRFGKIVKVAKNIQIDVMDGKFVKTKSLKISEIPNLKRYRNEFEVHLMTKNPEDYIDLCVKKGFDKIIAHVEAIDNYYEMIKHVKNHRVKIFLAINPETNVRKVEPWLKDIDGVLLMGVHPGKEHQILIPGIYNKVKILRKMNSKIIIQIDGGVNTKNINKLRKTGADIFNSGSFVAESKNPKQAIKELEKQ